MPTTSETNEIRRDWMGREIIVIRYYAIENGRKGCGWLPIVRSSVGDSGNTWQSVGYDKDDALAIGQSMAEDMASRFVGDYQIIVEAGEEPAPRVVRA